MPRCSAGTLPALGAIRSSSRFEMEIEDPVLARSSRTPTTYEALPLIS